MENIQMLFGIFILNVLVIKSHGTQKCDNGLIQGKLIANCSQLNFNSVPTDLRHDIKVLDLSSNNIRVIENHTFSMYSSIEYLYLSDIMNRIRKFESHALLPLSRLKVLDLRRSLDVINIENISYLFFPPSLLTLYLDGSFNGKYNAELPNLRLNQLQWLSMKNCGLKKLPSFGGTLMNLVRLELEDNELSELKSEDLTIFCQLKTIHLSNNTIFGKSCECKKLQSWTKDQQIHSPYGFCFSNDVMKKCANTTSDFNLTGYNLCLSNLKTETFWFWAKIAGIFIVIVLLAFILYLKCRKKMKN